MERKKLSKTLFTKALTQRLASTVARSNSAKRSLWIAF
ncbi:hypothetical protein LEP1GSC065_1439 [Leptospira kirschneri serovar Sokoine str. RM1]|nr:hypothetical protein LEP1GSC065_1439 [Leptospira kirschneri serovar Sokoine str. RM1]